MEEDLQTLYRKLKTTKERVEWLLQRFPETRNDDFYLYLLYIRYFCPELSNYIKFIPYDLVKKAPRPETIRRVRQKIQEEGRLLPTDPKVLKKRKKLARLYRKVIHHI